MYYTPYNAQAIIIILYVNQQKSVHIYYIIYLWVYSMYICDLYDIQVYKQIYSHLFLNVHGCKGNQPIYQAHSCILSINGKVYLTENTWHMSFLRDII